jgi:hypothetical protein
MPETYPENNVVAVFDQPGDAQSAVKALESARIPQERMSYLGKGDAADDVREEADAGPEKVGKGALGGSAAGGAAGGAAGLLAGLAALAIPGVGAAVGAGIWAATAGGAMAGATAGGVIGGIDKMWDSHLKDAVSDGKVLVGVHSDDPAEVSHAAAILLQHAPVRLDQFDRDGNPSA